MVGGSRIVSRSETVRGGAAQGRPPRHLYWPRSVRGPFSKSQKLAMR
jgi:hypothetical protein